MKLRNRKSRNSHNEPLRSYHTDSSRTVLDAPHLKPLDPVKKNRLKKVLGWVKHNPKKSIPLILIIILAISAGVYTLVGSDSEPKAKKPAVEKVVKPKKYYSPLTGREVSASDSKLPVIGVMIENSTEARPQSGLAQAGVVFESVAEGGITRFLVLYQEDKPALIGPVRSVRPQYASWVAAFDAGLAHVGGSQIPLRKLRSGQIKDLDQFFNPAAYYRANDRYAPHNMYTSHSRLLSLARSKGYKTSNFTSWERQKADEETKDKKMEEKSDKKDTEESSNIKKPTPATKISVPVSTGLFSTSYNYNIATKTYSRIMSGTPHTDREKGAIKPSVVIVLQVPHDAIRDSNGYSYPNVNSSGGGWVFQNGEVIKIKWSKASDKAQIKLINSVTNKPVVLAPGQTWVAAIKPGTAPTW